jgi:YebC/PmpR family DNA-binding regulatory protein
MSGHSKWSTIKRKKGAADAKKGREFSKLIRVIIAAVKEGGDDIDKNARLRTFVDKAKAINMPKETLAGAIQRGAHGAEGVTYTELSYEGYGPSGVALLIEVLTDNKNRTAAEVRHILTKYGGSLGESGCVAWMFTKKGVVLVNAEGADPDTVMEIALDNGAEDIVEDGAFISVTCAPADVEKIKKALEAKAFKIESAEVSMEAQTQVQLDEKSGGQVLKIIDLLEDQDDVQNVYSNFDIPEEIMEKLAV